MRSEEVLEGCLDAHRRLLELEQGLRAWLNEMTGYERQPAAAEAVAPA